MREEKEEFLEDEIPGPWEANGHLPREAVSMRLGFVAKESPEIPFCRLSCFFQLALPTLHLLYRGYPFLLLTTLQT